MKNAVFILILTLLIGISTTTNATIIPGCAQVTWTSTSTGILRCPLACNYCARTFYENGVWGIEINWPSHQIYAKLDEVVDDNGDPLDENQLEENPSLFDEATFTIVN
jgi:hypothetical protein